MPSLFISYRRADSPDTVKLIHERLSKRLPRWEIFYDHHSIPPGEPFPDHLGKKVASATAVLVIIGPSWLHILKERQDGPRDHVREEVRLALESGTCVIPVLVGHAHMPTDANLASFPDLAPLLQRNGQPIRPDPDFNNDLDRIVACLIAFDAEVAVGTILDDKFTLTAEIGVGGMGVVYAAQQKHPVQRAVAIKLIKPGMDSRDILARFDAERQALAVMDHPNIAKVLDAGMSANGRPFFAMEYIGGVPITQYCDDKKLTPQERLNLFILVCNAVQHAHQKGILHRDLKPSNVLIEVVDGKPVPKVIDFGLAKALGQKLTDKTLHTSLDTRVGTLEYSAPEQAAGRSFDVDTRSDIYSLGVLLYELLTGSLPFTHEELQKVGEEEMRRVIREVEPVKPSKRLSSSGELPAIAANRQLEPNKLTRMVQGDLDWIVMKCLEKQNARRYETANQLGQELQRFLADEPIQAGPPSAGYRMKKFLRRNKGPAIAAALVFLVLIAGIIGTSVGLFQAEQARGAEKEATQKAVKAAESNESLAKTNEKLFEDEKKARVQEELANAALDKALKRVNRETQNIGRVRNVLSTALMRLEDQKLANVAGVADVRDWLTKESLGIYVTYLEDDPSPEVQALAGDTYLFLGALYRGKGDHVETKKAYRRAIEIQERLAARFPKEQEYLNRAGQAHHILAIELAAYGDSGKDQSKEIGEECLKAAEAYRRALALDSTHEPSLSYMAWFLAICPAKDLRKPFEAIELAKKLVDAARRRPQGDRAFFDQLSNALNSLGTAHYRAGHLDDAIAAITDAMDYAQKSGEIRLGYAYSHNAFIMAMAFQGRAKQKTIVGKRQEDEREAAQWFDRAVAWMETNRRSDAELQLFRREAEEMGLRRSQ